MKTKKLKKANAGMVVKPAKEVSAKPVVKKPVATKPVATKLSNIYGINPTTGKEEQMVYKQGRLAFQKKKGGSAKAMPKAMYGKSIMKKGGAKKK
jgi:hypothetical protein